MAEKDTLLSVYYPYFELTVKGVIYDPVKNYTYVVDTKVSVSIKKTNANKCTIKRDIFI